MLKQISKQLWQIGIPLPTVVLIGLLMALALASSMAFSSSFDNHPDELHHFLAARYYTNHFLPPEIGDLAVRDTYSVWGVSYLNLQWVEYFLAGKFIVIVSPLVSNPEIAARCFQLFLLAALSVFLVLRSKRDVTAAFLAVFLLVTPQVWYVFSYVNNDAFALVIAFVIAYQLAAEDSLLYRFLRDDGTGGAWATGLLLGLLLISKSNYWVFAAFAAGWLLIKLRIDFKMFKKYTSIAAIALLVVGFRISLDLYVNGETNFVGASYISYITGSMTTNGSKLAAYQEGIVDRAYKPSIIANDPASAPPDVQIAARGVPFIDIFKKWDWHRLSFYSFTGVYGYMTIFGPKAYYNFMALAYLALAAYVVIRLLYCWKGQPLFQLSITMACAAICIFSSAYLSWTYAFQAQGRYLFPILPMTAVLVVNNRRFLNDKILVALFVAAFAASVYSFVFVGLARIG